MERWGPGRLSHSLFIWAWLWRISSAEKNGFAGEPSGLYPGPLGNVGGRALFGWGTHTAGVWVLRVWGGVGGAGLLNMPPCGDPVK